MSDVLSYPYMVKFNISNSSGQFSMCSLKFSRRRTIRLNDYVSENENRTT